MSGASLKHNESWAFLTIPNSTQTLQNISRSTVNLHSIPGWNTAFLTLVFTPSTGEPVVYKIRKLSTVLAALALFTSSSSFAADKTACSQPLSFGVVPQQSATKLAKIWSPILKRVSAEIGCKVTFKTAPNIPTFEERLRAGEYDLAYMNPYHYTVFSETPGYVAFGKAKDRQIKGIMVVRKDSGLDSLDALNGATLAFPAPAAFAATLLSQATLRKEGVDFKPRYVSSHDSVYRAVAKGLYPAGGGIVRTLNNVDPTIRDQLRVLWESTGYTPHAFAYHPRLPRSTFRAVTDAFLAMDADDAGRELLGAMKIKGIEHGCDREWNDVRDLRIEVLKEKS